MGSFEAADFKNCPHHNTKSRSILIVNNMFLKQFIPSILVAPQFTMGEARASSQERSNQAKLLQAHIVFRHGARTPVFWNPNLTESLHTEAFRGKCELVNLPPGVAGSHAYPSFYKAVHLDIRDLDGEKKRPRSTVDSFQLKAIYGECRAGQLTDLGAQQSANLGKELKNRYGDLSKKANHEKRLWIRTSNVARCVATLEFVLGEMFYDEDSGEEEQIFTTMTAPNEIEWLYPNTRCSLMAQLMFAAKEDWSNDPVPGSVEVVEELRKRLPPKTFKALHIEGYNFVRVRDYLVSYEQHGLRRPWINDDELAKKIEDLGAQQIARYLYHGHDEFSVLSAQAGVGNLLKVIFDAVLKPKHVETDPKQSSPIVSIVSAHDTTLMPILSACGVWDGKIWPEFCSWLAFELWDNGTVKLVFNGEVSKSYTIEEFNALQNKLVPEDGRTWEDLCNDVHPSLPSLSATTASGDHW